MQPAICFEKHRRINTQNEETAMNERNTLLCIDEGKELAHLRLDQSFNWNVKYVEAQ